MSNTDIAKALARSDVAWPSVPLAIGELQAAIAAIVGGAITTNMVYGANVQACAVDRQLAVGDSKLQVLTFTVSGKAVLLPQGNAGWVAGEPLVIVNPASRDEQQTITFTGGPTGGTFKLTFNGVESAAINWNATPAILAANIEAGLNALSTVNGGVRVSSLSATDYLVKYGGQSAALDQPLLVLSTNALTGGVAPAATFTETWKGRSAGYSAAVKDYSGRVLLPALGPGEAVIARLADPSTAAGSWDLQYLPSLATPSTAPTAAAAARAQGGAEPVNWCLNGGMEVAQYPVLTTAANMLTWTLGNTAFIGAVDAWAGYASAGVVTAGSLIQDAAPPAGLSSTGRALRASGLTLTGAAKWCFATRIESIEARKLANGPLCCGINLHHDIGLTKFLTMSVYTPTAADNYAARTLIAQAAAVACPDSAVTPIVFTVRDMADCSNGIEVVFELDTGAIVTKNIRAADAFAVRGLAPPASFPLAKNPLQECLRMAESTFPAGTAPQQAAGAGGALRVISLVAGVAQGVLWQFQRRKRTTAPSITLANPSAANANARDFTAAADISAVTVVDASDARVFLTWGNAPVGDVSGVHAFAHAGLY